MRISVAMCTYNGARHLGDQLASIAAQELRPSELVVCDDGSTDDTVEILRHFGSQAPFEVRVQINSTNLGIAANFSRVIGLCQGDLIALADQDDVWVPHKLQRLHDVFAESPAIGLAFSDADAIDDVGRSLGYRLWEAVNFCVNKQAAANRGELFRLLLRYNTVTGAAMAFRAEYRKLVLPIPPFCEHDAWIAVLISALAPCRAIPEPLILYRQHNRQYQGEQVLSLYRQYQIAKGEGGEKFDLVAKRYEAAHEQLQQQCSAPEAAHALQALREKVQHFRAKSSMRQTRFTRLPWILGELVHGRYARYSRGWKSVLQDLFL